MADFSPVFSETSNFNATFSEDGTFDSGLSEPTIFTASDHRKLNHRDDEDQHPIEAITGLRGELDSISNTVRVATAAQWATEPTYVPFDGQIIVYKDYKVVDGKTYAGTKVGDGTTYIVDLPFTAEYLEDAIENHIMDVEIHVSAADRIRWDNKVTLYLDEDGNLVFSKE